jgi:hypothetical protein
MPNPYSNLQVICLESDAFQALVKEAAGLLKEEVLGGLDPWLDEKEAMELMKIKSRTTLKKYREEGKIDYRRLSAKQIIYRRTSVLEFIENSPK